MEKPRDLQLWAGVGVISLVLLLWAIPQTLLLAPLRWTVSWSDARIIALERLRDLGEPVASGELVARLVRNQRLERRLRRAERGSPDSTLSTSHLAGEMMTWEVHVFAPGARANEWSHRARIALDGRVLALERRVDPATELGTLTAEEARLRADDLLVGAGMDSRSFVRVEEHLALAGERQDRTLRYHERGGEFGSAQPYGVEVGFRGAAMTGLRIWYGDGVAAADSGFASARRRHDYVSPVVRVVLLVLLAAPFLRRHRAGEIGVRRGLQVAALLIVLGGVSVMMVSDYPSDERWVSALSFQQAVWAWRFVLALLVYIPLALAAGMSASLGEAICRERWSEKLAAFDAFWRGYWTNATVARSAVRGALAGVALAAGMVLLTRLSDRFPQALTIATDFESLSDGSWMGIALLALLLFQTLFSELLGRLLLVPACVRMLGSRTGVAVSVMAGALVLWASPATPVVLSPATALLVAAALVGLFLAYDLLTSMMASLLSMTLLAALPLMMSASLEVELQGYVALLGALTPALVSLRSLRGGQEWVG